MLEFVFFDDGARLRFVDFLAARGLPCEQRPDTMAGCVVAVPEDLPDALFADIGERYDALMAEQSALAERDETLVARRVVGIQQGFQNHIPRGFARQLLVHRLVRARILQKGDVQVVFRAGHEQSVQFIKGQREPDALTARCKLQLNRLVRFGVKEKERLSFRQLAPVMGGKLKVLRTRKRPEQVHLHGGEGQVHTSSSTICGKQSDRDSFVYCRYHGLTFCGIFVGQHAYKSSQNPTNQTLFIEA